MATDEEVIEALRFLRNEVIPILLRNQYPHCAEATREAINKLDARIGLTGK